MALSYDHWLRENPVTVWMEANECTEYQLMRRMNRIRTDLGRHDTQPVTFQLVSALRRGNLKHRDKFGDTFEINANDIDLLARATDLPARAMLEWLAKAPEQQHDLRAVEHYWKLANPLLCMREIMRVTAGALAKKSGINSVKVSHIEHGSSSCLAAMSKVSYALGIDFKTFVSAYIEWLQDRPLSYQERGAILIHDVDFAGFGKVVADRKKHARGQRMRYKSRSVRNGSNARASGGTEKLP